MTTPGMMPTYPAETRSRFFAMKFLRLLAKTAAAQIIGADACWMLTVIVTTEDVTRYRRGVTFYNEQLMPLLGITRWHRLDAIRRKAIGAGWLHYEAPPKGLRGKPGVYWVTIPAYAEGLPDSQFDEGELSTESVDTPVDSHHPPSTESVDRCVDTPVDGCVDRCVEPPYPTPNPEPNPNKKQARAGKRFIPPTVEEVSEYAKQIDFKDIDAAYFVDYYAARDWKLKGGQKMSDWQAAVRTWKRNETQGSNGNGRTNGYIGPRKPGTGNGAGQSYAGKDSVSF